MFRVGVSSVMTMSMAEESLPAQNCSCHQLAPTPTPLTWGNMATRLWTSWMLEGRPTLTAGVGLFGGGGEAGQGRAGQGRAGGSTQNEPPPTRRG